MLGHKLQTLANHVQIRQNLLILVHGGNCFSSCYRNEPWRHLKVHKMYPRAENYLDNQQNTKQMTSTMILNSPSQKEKLDCVIAFDKIHG